MCLWLGGVMIICVIFQICVPLVNQFSLIFNRIEDYLSSCGLKKPDNLVRERDLTNTAVGALLLFDIREFAWWIFMNTPDLKALENRWKTCKKQIQWMWSFISFTDHGTSSCIANKTLGSSLWIRARSLFTGWNILI